MFRYEALFTYLSEDMHSWRLEIGLKNKMTSLNEVFIEIPFTFSVEQLFFVKTKENRSSYKQKKLKENQNQNRNKHWTNRGFILEQINCLPNVNGSGRITSYI